MLGKQGLFIDGGAAVGKLRKRHGVKLAGTVERRTPLYENSAMLVRTVLLSSDV